MRTLVAIMVLSVTSGCATATSLDRSYLFSWRPVGQPWHFAFFSGPDIPATREALQHPRELVVGVPALEQRLLRFQSRATISWRSCPPYAVFPPHKVVSEVQTFARQHGRDIELVPMISD
jgi:hypothetical protein